MKNRTLQTLLCLLVAGFILLLARKPYLHQRAVGEENFFSQQAIWAYRGAPYQDQLPVGELQARYVAQTGQHPAAPYRAFHLYGKLLRQRGVLSPEQIVTLLRVMQTVVFVGALVALFAGIIGPVVAMSRRLAALALGTLLFSVPFWIGASIQLQQDGVIGTLPYMLLFGGWLVRARYSEKWFRYMPAVAAAALTAIDKPERAVLFWLAMCAGALGLEWRRDRLTALRGLVPELAGFAAGTAIVLMIDGSHWKESWAIANPIVQYGAKISFVEFTFFLARFFPPTYFILLGIPLALLLRRWKSPFLRDRLAGLIVFTVLMFAFAFKSRWYGDSFPRYFAPPLMLLQLFTILFVAGENGEALSLRRWTVLRGVFVVAILGYVQMAMLYLPAPGQRSITSAYRAPLKLTCPAPAPPDCVNLVPLDCMNFQSGPSWILRVHDLLPKWTPLPLCAPGTPARPLAQVQVN